MKKEGKRQSEEEGEQYAEERLLERIETIQSEMETVPGGRLDACLAVSQGMFDREQGSRSIVFFSKLDSINMTERVVMRRTFSLTLFADDDASISNLSKTTSHCFDTDKVRLLYIRAQVSRIGKQKHWVLP